MTQPLIDAHHHIWAPVSDPAGLGYVWLRDIGAMKPFGDPTPIQRDYLLDEFRAEPAPVQLTGSVHLQCDPKLPDPVAESLFIQGIAERSGFPIMIVGFADLTSDRFEQTLERHMACPNLRGLRQIISHLPLRPDISFATSELLENPTWRRNYATLAQHGLSFDLQLYPEQMLRAAAFLAQHPDIPVVIDHLGSPHDTSKAGLALWHQGMQALAALPHVHVKLGGYAMFFGADLGPVPRDLTHAALDLFGPNRVMFGSNFPVDKLHLCYTDLLTFVTDVAGDDAPWVLHDTAVGFYRFPKASTDCSTPLERSN